MSKKGKMAYDFFKEGYNCAQAVLCSFCEETGLSMETSAMIASGFGAGMGRTRNVCGTVSGMLMAADMIMGYSKPNDMAEKKRTYEMAQTLINSFKKKNGSIICAELLGLKKNEDTLPIPSERDEEYYKKRPCAVLAQMAADILNDYLEINKNGAAGALMQQD